jgi:hypothetical protein
MTHSRAVLRHRDGISGGEWRETPGISCAASAMDQDANGKEDGIVTTPLEAQLSLGLALLIGLQPNGNQQQIRDIEVFSSRNPPDFRKLRQLGDVHRDPSGLTSNVLRLTMHLWLGR